MTYIQRISTSKRCPRYLKSILAVTASALIFAGCGKAADTPTPSEAGTTSSVPASVDAVSSSSVSATETAPSTQSYKDGTYSATGNYDSPGGPEQIEVSLTLKNGQVTESTYKGDATLGKSQKYQETFGQGYQTLVVGKSIDQLSLDVVNGASLTPKGFMDAVEKIKAQAKA
jgi:uncharacterized protein with FMN-binding domain